MNGDVFLGSVLFSAAGAMLVVAGCGHVRNLAQFEVIVNNHGLLPYRIRGLTARAIPWSELFVGGSLLLSALWVNRMILLFACGVGVALGIVFSAYSGALLVKRVGGDCGCDPWDQTAVSWLSVVRALVLVMFCSLGILVFPDDLEGPDFSSLIGCVAGSCAGWLLLRAPNYLSGVTSTHERIGG